MSSLSTILPFIRALEPVLADPDVSEVMVNAGGRRIFVERSGRLHPTGLMLDERHLKVAIKNIARACNDEVSETRPIMEARLEDGSRVSAILPPCAPDGIALTIRKFARRFSLSELVDVGMLTNAEATTLSAAVRNRQNMLISGGSGTGKTTLLNALAAVISDEERIVTIEETTEIAIDKPNVIRLEARLPRIANTDKLAASTISIGDLLKTSLRHRPDRLIVGEVRGPEAWDLLQAMNTGHAGTISTIHANSAEHAFARFAHCVLGSRLGLPYDVLLSSIRAVVGLVIHVERRAGQRKVSTLLEVHS
jgi:pilus assembly protein CpaF